VPEYYYEYEYQCNSCGGTFACQPSRCPHCNFNEFTEHRLALTPAQYCARHSHLGEWVRVVGTEKEIESDFIDGWKGERGTGSGYDTAYFRQRYSARYTRLCPRCGKTEIGTGIFVITTFMEQFERLGNRCYTVEEWAKLHPGKSRYGIL
jgi:RNA polymerase subunit RPABC4/transcription elongation factor Spt4